LKTELALASKPGRSEEELRAAIEGPPRRTDRLTRIADDLLLLARAEQGGLRLKTSSVDVMDVLEEVGGRFRTDRNARWLTATRLSSRPTGLRLVQALTNLVDNALRHGNGAITVVGRRRERDSRAARGDEGAGFGEASSRRRSSASTRGDESAREGGAAWAFPSSRRSRGHHGSACAANLPGAVRMSGFPCRS
jgi:signal transduction histidine kinase